MGPLTVHPTNPRYFADDEGNLVYLVGTCSGFEQQDNAWSTALTFDFDAWLTAMQSFGHNYLRYWVVESTRWDVWDAPLATPMAYERSAGGTANDGGNLFDLTQLNDAYFTRLRTRCLAAQNAGIYVGVMLFQGHSVHNSSGGTVLSFGHPYLAANNASSVAGLGGNVSGNIHTLADSAITALQEAYIERVVDELNDLDNVLYEICNEPGSTQANAAQHTTWQNAMITHVNAYQATKPQQHPINVSTLWTAPVVDRNASLLASAAQAVGLSRNGGEIEIDDIPLAPVTKVSMLDTDHVDFTTTDPTFAWRAFMRGHNPQSIMTVNAVPPLPDVEMRAALGDTRRYIDADFAPCIPSTTVSSTGHALVNPGERYIVWQPTAGAAFTVDLAPGSYTLEWFDTVAHAVDSVGFYTTLDGGSIQFVPPVGGNPVTLQLRATSPRPVALPAQLLRFVR